MKSTRWHFPAVFVLLLLVALHHWRILLGGEILCGGDMIGQFVPWREFALREWAEGRFPIWNPFVFCGTPFAANIQTSLFYPWNLFNLIFSVERTFTLCLVFHQALASMAMYAFLYRLWKSREGAVLGALVYGWSGFMITHGYDGHLIHVRAYALLPLALYLQTGWLEGVRMKTFVLFAASLAGMFYAGHTQIPLYIFYLLLGRAVVWGVYRYRDTHSWRAFFLYPFWTLAGQLLAIGLAALVLVPLAELSLETAGRSGGADYAFATSDSMPPLHVLTLIAPFLYGDPVSPTREGLFWETKTGYHEIAGYVGLLPLLLLWFAFLPEPGSGKEENRFVRRETLFFALAAFLGLLFATGSYTPLYSILYYGLPGWSYFRVPGRLLLIFIIGVSVLTARGYALWRQTGFAKIRNTRLCQTAVVASVLLVLGTVILAASKPAALAWLRELEIDRTIEEFDLWFTRRIEISQRLPEILFETRYAGMLRAALTASGWCAASWIALGLASRTKKRLTGWLPVLVLSLDLLVFAGHFSKTLPADRWRETYFPDTELTRFLRDNTQEGRILCLDDAIGYPALESHPELRPNRLMHYGISTVRGYDPIILRSFTRFVNQTYNLDPDAPQGGLLFLPTLPSQEALATLNVRLIVTCQSLPGIYRILWKDEQSHLTVYDNPYFRPFVFPLHEPENARITLLEKSASRIRFEVDLPAPNEIVLSQNAYRGWRLIEAIPGAELSRYKDTFLSIQAPQGHYTIALQMASFSLWPPTSFSVGGLVTGISCAICFYLHRRKKPLI